MKNLPNEKFSFAGQVIDTSIFSRVDFNVLNKIKSPSCLVVKNGFSSELSVGLHTNVVRLVAELITLGSAKFTEYVQEFCNNYEIELALVEILREQIQSSKVVSNTIDNHDLDNLLGVITRNRAEFLEFVNALKAHRPKDVSIKVNGFKDIENLEYKFYISYIEMSVNDSVVPTVFPINSQVLGGSFNLDFPFNVPSNYEEHINAIADKIDLFGVGFTLESVVEEFKANNNDIFNPSTFNLMVYSLPMIYSALYDILYKKVKGMVKIDVNEG